MSGSDARIRETCLPTRSASWVSSNRMASSRRACRPSDMGTRTCSTARRRGRSSGTASCWSATARAPARSPVVFLVDVDNTLLDNDRVTKDLRRYLVEEVGGGRAEQYFEIFEALRKELGYADYLGALQRYRLAHPRDPHLLAV